MKQKKILYFRYNSPTAKEYFEGRACFFLYVDETPVNSCVATKEMAAYISKFAEDEYPDAAWEKPCGTEMNHAKTLEPFLR